MPEGEPSGRSEEARRQLMHGGVETLPPIEEAQYYLTSGPRGATWRGQHCTRGQRGLLSSMARQQSKTGWENSLEGDFNRFHLL